MNQSNEMKQAEQPQFFGAVPAFGVGTFRLTGQTVIDSVTHALDLGYRAIDTAQIYDNEAEVGQAIEQSGVAQDELFITTKIWADNYGKDMLIPSLKRAWKSSKRMRWI